MLTKLFWLAMAGALGTLLRYAVAGVVQRSAGVEFPWGTLAVNVAGCFFAGGFTALWEDYGALTGETRTIILIGFLGAFTTFSSLILETTELLRDAEWAWAVGNLVAQNLSGMVGLLLGFAVVRVL